MDRRFSQSKPSWSRAKSRLKVEDDSDDQEVEVTEISSRPATRQIHTTKPTLPLKASSPFRRWGRPEIPTKDVRQSLRRSSSARDRKLSFFSRSPGSTKNHDVEMSLEKHGVVEVDPSLAKHTIIHETARRKRKRSHTFADKTVEPALKNELGHREGSQDSANEEVFGDASILRNFPVENASGGSLDVIDLCDSDIDEDILAPRDLDHRPSIIGPEDFLNDDDIAELLAALNLGLEQTPPVDNLPTITKIELEELKVGDQRYKPGKSVELLNGKFLRIVKILQDDEGSYLSGHLLVRQTSCGGMMPPHRNELVWILDVKKEDFDQGDVTKMSEFTFSEVKGLRSVTFTNQNYPQMSLRELKRREKGNPKEQLERGPLFCRRKMVQVKTLKGQAFETTIFPLTYAEADDKPKARIRSGLLRSLWRGSDTFLGGSHLGKAKSVTEFLNGDATQGTSTTTRTQQYTFGDAFCGAGGCSRGAFDAGLRLVWGFDKDKDALEIYAKNFASRGTMCLQEAVDEFCDKSSHDAFRVDILHLSPPCQPFSPAHTVPNEIQDEINQAALFSVQHVIERIKPRVITMEETEGLVGRHSEWFQALINIFVSMSHSVRWKVVNCKEYGVAQQRKRLYIIAAG